MDDASVANRAKLLFEQDEVCWRKSSKSTFNGNCVEVATLSNRVLVRDSKDPDPTLQITLGAWVAFIDRIKEDLI